MVAAISKYLLRDSRVIFYGLYRKAMLVTHTPGVSSVVDGWPPLHSLANLDSRKAKLVTHTPGVPSVVDGWPPLHSLANLDSRYLGSEQTKTQDHAYSLTRLPCTKDTSPPQSWTTAELRKFLKERAIPYSGYSKAKKAMLVTHTPGVSSVVDGWPPLHNLANLDSRKAMLVTHTPGVSSVVDGWPPLHSLANLDSRHFQ
ncbi:uncharacterized protein LOC135101233 isoform X3 [Scylla paramamosain]|uniref:uncharacterized protein LOC135101233 isoform X3 n=1 Tax=Scylla paramamosain TaxID=85552 RepID=UPI003083BB72